VARSERMGLLPICKKEAAAERNRSLAETYILGIANSFKSDDPLRKSFLFAPPVQRVLDRS